MCFIVYTSICNEVMYVFVGHCPANRIPLYANSVYRIGGTDHKVG